MESLLLTDKDVAALLGMSTRHIWSLKNKSAMPAPLHLGRTTRWRRTDIVKWIDAGCPAVRTTE